jgi:NAD(P)-dependent dehydrogenase (short-subunit alcohol dehydrogenase family)
MLADTLSLAGKVALVTGSGKENGIGASTFSATYVRETLHVSAHAYNYAS